MDDEKRMVDTYEIKHAIHVGDKEILFGVDNGKIDCPYMVCSCTWDNPLGIDHYFNAVGSADYLEMMSEFTSRVAAQLDTVKSEQSKITVPLKPLTLEHCLLYDSSQNLENKVAVIQPERLCPEYRTADKQLVLVTGGFGAHANSRGRAVYTINLYSGKESRWNREDILGVIKPECMPDWANERLKQIKTERNMKQNKHEPER